jgi:isochorismate synthase
VRLKTSPHEPSPAEERLRVPASGQTPGADTGTLLESPARDAGEPWGAFRAAWDATGPAAGARTAVAWESPDGETFAALGAAAEWSCARPDALGAAREAIPRLIAGIPGASIAFGVFPFEPGQEDAPARWIVPERLWWRGRGGSVVVETAAGAGGEPPRAEARRPVAPSPRASARASARAAESVAFTRDGWGAAVRDALERIESGAFEKVVLARAATIGAAHPYDPLRVFEALRATQPGAFRFLLAPGDGTAFLGASPERLIRLADGFALADSIAGTARRGTDAAEDARLAAELLASAKDRREHAAVAREVREALEACCEAVEPGLEPDVLALRDVLHLRSRVRGIPRPGTHVLDLVARLHPTPAVAGTPRAEALAWIRGSEPSPRGWYAGPVGWMNAAGEGDFAVGLRCALLEGAHARVYAGAGLVAGSDPAAEWTETELKMRSMRDALADA